MLTGECSVGIGNLSEPINETLYLSKKAQADELIFHTICIVVGLVGLVLNSLSLIVFAKVFFKSSKRNNFHLFFLLLSFCEITFCIGSVMTYSIQMVSNTEPYSWTGFDPSLGEKVDISFYSSVNLPGGSSNAAVVLFAGVANLSNYLAVLSQFSRNCWVGITALLRCYIATRRTNVQVNKIYATRRILLMFFVKLFIIIGLAIVRTYLKDPGSFMRMEVYMCNTSDWVTSSRLLLHMPNKQPKYWSHVDMGWNILAQFIPLVVIIASSVILVFSLRNGAGVGSSSAERNKRVTRMVIIFAITFAVLEGPRAIVYAIPRHLRLRRLPQVTFFLSQADSIVNVFIYFFNDQHFRKALCGEQQANGSRQPRPPQTQQQRGSCDACEEVGMLPTRDRRKSSGLEGQDPAEE
uniref:G_PROTEIN_RECEP_F1_2 domain-containing protein n=1 Tax=Macrostomum lignano TaxID=282301 RepID=A0A1I8GFA9_9PLAT